MPKRKQEPEEQYSQHCRVECETILGCMREALARRDNARATGRYFSPEFHLIQLLKSEAIFAFVDGEYIVSRIVSNPQKFHIEKKPGVKALCGFEAIDAAFGTVGMKELILLKWDKVRSPARDLYAAKAEGLARRVPLKPADSLKDKFISDLWPKYLSIMGWLQYLDPDRPIFLAGRTGESLLRCNRTVIEHFHCEAQRLGYIKLQQKSAPQRAATYLFDLSAFDWTTGQQLKPTKWQVDVTPPVKKPVQVSSQQNKQKNPRFQPNSKISAKGVSEPQESQGLYESQELKEFHEPEDPHELQESQNFKGPNDSTSLRSVACAKGRDSSQNQSNRSCTENPTNIVSFPTLILFTNAILELQKREDVTEVRRYYDLVLSSQERPGFVAFDLQIGVDSYEYCLSHLRGDVILSDDHARKRAVLSMKNAVLAAAGSKEFKDRRPLWSDIFGSEESRQRWIRIGTGGNRQSTPTSHTA